MKKLPYIEDYILLMGQDPFAWPPNAPLITLARYDENIIQSMYDQINRGLGFTDKQAVLAHKLVTKYHRQWGQNGYDVTGQIKNAKFKFPIRNIDRSKRIDIKDKFIHILFPYEQDVISVIRSSVSEVPGECYFDKELRLWVTSLIEPRIRWAKEFGDKYNFEFTETFLQVLSKVNAITDYRIELCRINGQLTITNAADSLNDYIESQVGMSDSNLIKLIDLSGPLC
ncbi:hypothetical protein EBU95_21670, partial [bacterium]|nr:hypothetical protein [bacterium]